MSIADFFECFDCGAPAHTIPADDGVEIVVDHKPTCPEVNHGA